MDRESLISIIWVFGIINIGIILAVLVFYFRAKIKKRQRQNKVDHFGDSAEKKVIAFLKKNFPRAVIMDSVYLKTPTGLTELDIIMLCDRGIFIIEVKSHNGYIITNGKFWTQRWQNKIVRFHNPIHQNNIHKAALEAIFRKRQSLASLPIYTVTVFTSAGVSFSRNVKDVIKFSSLNSYIKRKKTDKRMRGETLRTVQKFIASNMETSRARQNKHKRKIYERNAQKRAYRFNR